MAKVTLTIEDMDGPGFEGMIKMSAEFDPPLDMESDTPPESAAHQAGIFYMSQFRAAAEAAEEEEDGGEFEPHRDWSPEED